ncbi:MAG: hypothetical protein QNK42_02660 [Pseudodonghicola sp.]|nr:hypothetical protein [Pseudodonghicola sp.]
MSSSAPDQHGSNQSDNKAAIWLLVAVVLFLVLWATSVALFGVPGLYIPALALVPVVWIVLILVSRG